MKQHFTDKKHYKYIGGLISPELAKNNDESRNNSTFRDNYEDVMVSLTSAQVSKYLRQVQKLPSNLVTQSKRPLTAKPKDETTKVRTPM